MASLYRIPLIAALLMLGATAAAQESTAPMADLPPAEDACLAALRNGAQEAERTCSDLIAGLRYDGAVTGPDRQALAAALGNRALARMRSGALEDADADFSEALELAPDAWALHLNRATLALMNGDAGAALNYLGRVRQLVPADPAALAAADRNSILAWRMLGNLDAAAALSRGQQPPVAPAPPPG
jgi:tetratricopeptide (TPR) repeat protein